MSQLLLPHVTTRIDVHLKRTFSRDFGVAYDKFKGSYSEGKWVHYPNEIVTGKSYKHVHRLFILRHEGEIIRRIKIIPMESPQEAKDGNCKNGKGRIGNRDLGR